MTKPENTLDDLLLNMFNCYFANRENFIAGEAIRIFVSSEDPNIKLAALEMLRRL